MLTQTKPRTVDEYIATFPADIQHLLEQLRATVTQAAPAAVETIKYGMPTYVLDGNLVYFAAFKNHLSFFAAPTSVQAFKEQLATYKTGKGSIQLPFDQPLPLELIGQMVAYRIRQNAEKRRVKEALGPRKAGK